jgi:hypothetical protein
MGRVMRILAEWPPWHRWRVVAEVADVDLVSDRIPRKGVVLVGSIAQPKWAVLDCPCGDGHRLIVNLDKTRRPNWRIEVFKPLSIRPSIDDQTLDRRCHFTIGRGRIRWAHNYRD